MTRRLLFTAPIAALAIAAACNTPDAAWADNSQPLNDGQADEHERKPPPPPSCDTNDDCEDACPDGSQGCTCHDTPHGKACVPSCSDDDDCPDIDGPQLRCHEGVCKPPPPSGPPPPKKCSEQADCDDGCPPGSKGCVCHDTPKGKACVPSCSEDDDCPRPPGAAAPSCEDGICRPPPPPKR